MRPWKIILIVVGMICVLFMAFIFPRLWPALKIMREFGQYSSEAEAKAALNRNPNDAKAHYTLAEAAQRRNDRKTLLAELETAQRLDPSNEWYKMELSIALQIAGRSDEAVPLLQSITNPSLVPEAQAALRKITKKATTPTTHATPLAPH